MLVRKIRGGGRRALYFIPMIALKKSNGQNAPPLPNSPFKKSP